MSNYKKIIQNVKYKVFLEKYRVTEEVLGHGSFGVVLDAINIMTFERVAVKFSYS